MAEQVVVVAKQVTLIEQLKDLIHFPIVIFNKLLSSFNPYEVYILFIISATIGFYLKGRWKTGNIEFAVISFTLFFALRFILGI